MSKSTEPLKQALALLTRRARTRGLTDSAWAERAGISKETLSRLRHRESCDFETLCALADALGARVAVLESPAGDATADGHFPMRVDREYEERLLELCA
jgi:transcriptional regulator with XRE-family HTH domain